MEHRWSTRRPIRLEVLAYCRKGTVVHGRTRDIGLGGMFFQTSEEDMAVGARMDVELFLNKSESCCFKALVVHAAEDGFGLMFCPLDPDASLRLDQLLHADAKHS